MAGNILASGFFVLNQGDRQVGWEEGIYLPTATNLGNALPQANDYFTARARMLGVGAKCDYIRVSNDSIKGDSQIINGIPTHAVTQVDVTQYNMVTGVLNAPITNRTLLGMSTAGDPSGALCDFSSSAYLVRLEGKIGSGADAYLYRRSLKLVGNPDAAQNTAASRPQGAPWRLAYNTWKGLLTGTPQQPSIYGFRVVDRTNNTPKQISAVAGAAQPYSFTATAHGLAVGDQVRVSGVKFLPTVANPDPPLVNGLWTISAVPDPNTFQLLGFTGTGATMNLLKMGTVIKRTYGVATINNVIGRRWTAHRLTAPFSVPRSKRRTPKK